MKLASKLQKNLKEALKDYNGKKMNFNAEAGDTTYENGHWHKTMIDENGNGKTIHTMTQTDSDETGKAADDHVHAIVNYEVQEAEGHVHDIVS